MQAKATLASLLQDYSCFMVSKITRWVLPEDAAQVLRYAKCAVESVFGAHAADADAHTSLFPAAATGTSLSLRERARNLSRLEV